MSYLTPIRPLVHLPSAQEKTCLDHSTEDERRRELRHGQRSGLARLIRHPRTPETGTQGLAQGIWSDEFGEGVYLHREEYSLPGGVEKTRWSVVVGLDIERCPIHPIVETRTDEVEGLMAVIAEAGVDPGGITAIYRDPNHHLEQLVDARSGVPPHAKLRDSGGKLHALWCLSEEEGEAVIALLERCAGGIVGDVAVYRALGRLRQEPASGAVVAPLVHFYHQRDFGVSFAATARIHPLADGFDINQLLALLHETHEVKEHRLVPGSTPEETYRPFFEQVRTDGITRRVFGLLVRGNDTAFQVSVPDGQGPHFGDVEIPDVAREFDVEWVARGVARAMLPEESKEPSLVLSDPRQAPAILEAGEGQLAFVLNPPPKRFLPVLSEVGWRLPVGALQLKPPVPRGLFLNNLPSVRGVIG